MIKDSENPIYSMNAESFIKEFVKTYKLEDLPENLAIIKTGHGKINSPLMNFSKILNAETPCEYSWFKIRTASIFRKLVIKNDQNSKVSIKELRNVYGTSKNRGCKPTIHVKGSKYVIRLAILKLIGLNLIDEQLKVTEKGKEAVERICV